MVGLTVTVILGGGFSAAFCSSSTNSVVISCWSLGGAGGRGRERRGREGRGREERGEGGEEGVEGRREGRERGRGKREGQREGRGEEGGSGRDKEGKEEM